MCIRDRDKRRQNGQHQPAQRPPAELHKARLFLQAGPCSQIGFNLSLIHISKENRNSARIWWRVLLVLGLLGAAWLAVSGVEPRADALTMSEIAQRWIQGDYSDFDTGEYLFCYPYQLGYGLLLEEMCIRDRARQSAS